MAASIALAFALGAAGCSRGDGTTATTTTAAEVSWSERLDDRCAALDDEFGHLAAADPTTTEDAVTYAEDVDAFAEALVAVIEGVDDEGRAEVRPLQSAAVELEAATSRLLDGAIARDRDAVDAATAEVNALAPRLNELAAGAGLASCGGF